MKPPVPADLANDNGKREDHLAVVVVALHKAVKGLDAPPKLIVDAVTVKPSVDATQPWGMVSGRRRTRALATLPPHTSPTD